MDQSKEYQGLVFHVGQAVWSRLPTPIQGPYTIMSLNERSCIVQTTSGRRLLRRYSSLRTV